MAIVNIVYDTKAKTCSVNMDGKKMEHLNACYIENYGDDKWMMTIRSTKKDEENDVSHYEEMITSENKPRTLTQQINEYLSR